jgi:hypothetical protein
VGQPDRLSQCRSTARCRRRGWKCVRRLRAGGSFSQTGRRVKTGRSRPPAGACHSGFVVEQAHSTRPARWIAARAKDNEHRDRRTQTLASPLTSWKSHATRRSSRSTADRPAVGDGTPTLRRPRELKRRPPFAPPAGRRTANPSGTTRWSPAGPRLTAGAGSQW